MLFRVEATRADSDVRSSQQVLSGTKTKKEVEWCSFHTVEAIAYPF